MSENNTMIFTLTFNTDGGGGEFYDVTGEAGSYYQLPSLEPGKPGYGFMGWKNSANITFQAGGDYYFNYGDDTLAAVWEPIELTLTFNLAGGTGEFPAITGVEAESIFLAAAPSRDGFTFSHWVNLTGETFRTGDYYYFNYGNDTLTAVWGATVTFNLDGGEGYFPDISGEVMTNTLIPEEIPSKAGYNFVKWTSARHSDFNPGDPYFFTGNDILTAVWEIAAYTLTYNLSGADAPESIESQYGQATTNILLSETVPTKEGFTFVRWENTAGEKFQPGEPYFFGYHDDTLTAVWGYTVTLDAKGGECEATTVVKAVGETLGVVPTKEGYTLFGWQRPNGDICNPYTFDFGHENLEAVWGFSITYDTKNGNESFPTQLVLPGAMFTIPETIPTKDGYNFEFWTTNPQDPQSGNQYFPGNTVTCYENMTLYAAWTSGVMFDANGGSCDAFLYTGFDTDVYEIPTATREGCTLMKWVNSQGVEFAPNGSYPFIYGNDTLTAIWGYTVTLNANGGECEVTTVTMPLGETLDIVPTKEGLNFLRWTNSEGLTFDASNPYTFAYGDDTLTAVWGYTVTYLNYDGTVFETEDALEGESVTVTENAPERFDHVFMYWVISETEKITIPGRALNMSLNVTLVPQWKEMYVIAFWADEDELFEVGDKLQGTDYEISFFAPAKEGYEFFCWKSRAHNEYYYPGEVYKRDEAMGFDAIWVENGKKKIVYSMGDVDGNFHEQNADINTQIAIHTAIPTKEGCTFNGWTVKEVPVEPAESVQTYSLMRTASSNISNGQYVGEDSAILTPDMTGSFTIEYLGRDGSVICTHNKPFGGSIILYGTGLTSGEYELAHWYDMDNPDNIYYPGESFSLDKDMCFGSTWLPASNFIGVSIFNKPENNTLYIGENHRLNAVAVPMYLTAKCTWEVDNENIATIDKNGVITPKSEGTITVTVEAKENENDDISYSDSCSLVIEERLDGHNLTPHGDFEAYTCNQAAVCNDGIGCDYGDKHHQDLTAYMGGILNADSHRYIVLPTDADNYWDLMGCVGVSIRSNGRYAFGVVGEGGPKKDKQGIIDEFSVRMIKDLGYKTDGAKYVSPKDTVTTYIFPETKRSSWTSKTLNVDVAAEGMKYFY